MRNTKWTNQVDMDAPELPDWFWERSGVTPVEGVVDEEVGEEVLLLINDPTDGAADLAGLDPFRFTVSCGALDTEHGSLGFMLFIVPNNEDADQPHAVWEILFDPADEEMARPFHALATQSHWHAVLFGPGPEVLNVFEFTNNYFLDAGMADIGQKTEGKPCTDFAAAVEAAHAAYSLEELFVASTQAVD